MRWTAVLVAVACVGCGWGSDGGVAADIADAARGDAPMATGGPDGGAAGDDGGSAEDAPSGQPDGAEGDDGGGGAEGGGEDAGAPPADAGHPGADASSEDGGGADAAVVDAGPVRCVVTGSNATTYVGCPPGPPTEAVLIWGSWGQCRLAHPEDRASCTHGDICYVQPSSAGATVSGICD